MKYNTGGVVKGTSGNTWGGKSIDKGAACMGTTANQPNVKDGGPAGGQGSSGTASGSKEK